MQIKNSKFHIKNSKKGFTLVEMLVSVALFSSVMLIGTGALLSLIDANRKAQSLNSVMNNLNFAIESMSRNIRVGATYHCEENNNIPPNNIDETKDCPNGGQLFAFEPTGGDIDDPDDQVVYRVNGEQLEVSAKGGSPGTFISITAPEVVIKSFSFYVDGTSIYDAMQPRVVMTIHGVAGRKEKVKTNFNLQTMVSQRVLDM